MAGNIIDDYAALENTIHFFWNMYDRLSIMEADENPSRRVVAEMRAMNSILFPSKRFGDLPGVNIGYQFFSRGEMAAVGFHSHGFKEVDYASQYDFLAGDEYEDYRYPIATSIVVLSMEYNEEVVYVSQSGQDLGHRNLALKNNEEQNIPVRLIRKHTSECKSPGMIYTYDGLYNVVKSCSEENIFSRLTYRLNRLEGQELTINQVPFMEDHPFGNTDDILGLCCLDISAADPERIPIIATNEVDFAAFSSTNYTYSKSVKIAENVTKPINNLGCNCQGNCSDPKTCPCGQPNGSYPYLSVDDGRLTDTMNPIIYECGEHCGCGSCCRNRVTQRGLQYRLEVFRTPQKGWGVRSWDPIPIGAYVCEYVGEIRRDEDADREPENMYLFNIDQSEGGSSTESAKYCIDGEKISNVVRFINHSCEPNLFVQSVLSEHRDIDFARIVLFAYTDIPIKEELTYDYGYEVDSVMDQDGKIKKMECHCGASNCRGRLM